MRNVLREKRANGKLAKNLFPFSTILKRQSNGDGLTNSHIPSINPNKKNNTLAEIGLMFIILIIYFFAGKLGLKLAYENASATAVWAPTGIAIAFFLLRGYHIFPAILLGAFLINVTTTGDIPTSIFIAIGNTLEGLVAAYLVNKFANGKHAFENVYDILKFAIFAGILATTISATIGVTSLSVFGFANWSDYLSIWLTWWLGDAVGAFLVAPLLIQWILNPRIKINKEKIIEGTLVILTLAVVCVIIFTPLSYPAENHYPFSYLIIPPFVWIAFRFSQRFITTAAFVISAVAIWGTLERYGPFVVDSRNDSLLFLQAFIGIITIMSISFSAAIIEKNKSRKSLEDSQKDLKDFIENASVGLHWVGPDGKIIWANKTELDLLGYEEDEYIGHHVSEFHHSQEKINEILTRLTSNETVHSYEAQLKSKDGSIKHVLISSNVYFEDGKFIHTRCFTKDITEKRKLEMEVREREHALREAERRRWTMLQRLLDKLPAGAYTCDAEGLITYYNEKALEVWGRAPKLNDPVDRYCGSFKLFLNDELINHNTCWMARALHNEQGYNGEEIVVEQPNGNKVTVLAHANPIYDDSGKLLGAVNVLVDINERKKFERYLNIQYSISKALAESGTSKEAAQKVIKSICEGIGWELGALWIVDNKSNVLRIENFWCKPENNEKYSKMVAQERTFEKGKGLPGRVWKTGTSAWVHDVTLDNNFPRAPLAVEAGLHAGLAFPVKNENEIIAVIECFNKSILEPREDLLNVLNASGRQIGNYLAMKKAEEEKQIAQHTYQSLFESTLDGILVVDNNGTYVNVNESYCKMLKGTREEIIGQNFSRFMPPSLFHHAAKAFEELKNTGYFRGEFPLMALDGSIVQAEWVSKANFIPGMSFCVARDISERKLAEKKLNEEYSFRKAIENSVASGIAAIDFNGTQTYVNPALCSMLGWTEEELTAATPPYVYWPPEEIENINNAFAKTLQGTAPPNGFELKFCRKNGERFDVLVNVNPIKDNEGKPSGWLASVTDISVMKKVEKELKDSYLKMEDRVTERTKELHLIVEEMEREITERKKAEEKLKTTQEELIHSEKLASLGRFASGIAHEIRNPLANISALAQLLNKDKSLDTRVRQHLDYILVNSDIANNIIKDLLIIASPHNVNLKSTKISDIIENLYNLIKPRCDKYNVSLSIELNENLPKVKTNQEKLQTAFLNFVSNSIDAMPQGGKLIISAKEDNQAKEVVVSFKDTGIGIPTENLDKVLEPFFTTKDTGTGLGLNLAYEVIKANSGKLNINSKVNEGTEIIIRLPVCKEC
jgi:PAS domain S-box-containing protein